MKEELKNRMKEIKADPKVSRALELLEETHEEIVELQMEICAVRAPSNMEEARAKRFF